FMPILGLPSHAAYPLIAGFAFGVQEGYSVVREAFEGASLSEKEADLLNHHIAIDHSWITGTCLYAAAGISTVWLLLPRIILAILVVWIEKLRRFLFRRSFRVHIGE
ncbi:MAG: transporter, partial [Treponema sp.]|nr:transporter [Treponema sp.]